MSAHPLRSAIQDVVCESDCDVYLYAGTINWQTCDGIINDILDAPKRSALFMLSSFGGDAHAAYRLARNLQGKYKGKFTLFIPAMCKSAGTLVAVGADDLVMSSQGELGPLDVQVSEPDELWEHRSGLVPSQALEAIREEAFTFFESSFLSLRARSGSQITTRTAAEIASRLAIGLFEPLVSQIDPLRVDDICLSMRIAEDYGRRLHTSNVKDDTIRKLVYEYPAHGFVLDREEATNLFEKVRPPTPAEVELAKQIVPLVDNALDVDALAVHLSSTEFLDLLSPEDDLTGDESQDIQTQREGEESETRTDSGKSQT